MSLELKKDSLKTGKKLCEASAEQKIDVEITLPDYCADIKKILRCTLVPGIHTVSLSGERASAKGTAVLRVIYLAEGDKADVFEKNLDLSCAAQVPQTVGDKVVVAASTVDFVNCRALSQRKILINASIGTIFTCLGTAESNFAVKGEEKHLQTKTQKLTCEAHLGFFEKTFDMAETVVLNKEHRNIRKILSCNYRCVPEDCKLSSGKLLVKGSVITDIYYLPEDSENKVCFLSHSMPVSQILDVREIADGAEHDVELKVCQQLCSVKADSSGSNRLLDLSLRVRALVQFSEKKDCEVITDCYCTDFESKEKYEEAELFYPVRKIKEARQIKGELELTSAVKEICFSKCLEIISNVKYGEDKVDFDCSALIFIMYLDEKGIPCCCEKNLDFSFSYSIVKKCKEPFGSFSLEPLSVNVALASSDKVELILDYTVSGKVFCNFEKKILKSLSINEEKPKTDTAAFTVYFAEEGESLWNIAREHNTTVKLIKEENGIDDECVDKKMMLMIPCG